MANEKINVILDSIVEEICGTQMLESLKVKNVKNGNIKNLAVSGVFLFVGWQPNTKFLESSNIKLENGYIITNENMETNLDGVFACGDVRKKQLRQVVTAASDGAISAISAQHYIENN